MRKKTIAMIILCIPFLFGCGNSFDTSSMTLTKDGIVKSYIVEDFSAAYYDASELEQSITADINSYNADYENEVIKLKEFVVEEGILNATITYENADVYEEFNEETLFFGSMSEAIEKGYKFDVPFYSVTDPTQKTDYDTIKKENNYHVVIFTEPVNVKVADKVVYISDGLQKGDGAKEVMVTDTTKEIYYIIYE